MKIVFIARGYPTKDKSNFAFVQPVVREFASRGIQCTVIAPERINKQRRGEPLRPYRWYDETESGDKIEIIQPKYIGFGGLNFMGNKLTTAAKEKAIYRVLKGMKVQPDALYGHFWDCALLGAKYGLKKRVPVIAVSGESTIDLSNYYSKKQIGCRLPAVRGVICVSTKNKNESKAQGLIEKNTKVLVSPNAIDTRLFYPMDRAKARRSLGVDENAFVVSYVGRYSARKGVNRLIEAMKSVKNGKMILIGYGEDLIESDQIAIARRVAHEDVAMYLNASDVYCLPTLAEGCCNSIVEAMACGLPIVSSDLDFNKDILDETTSILIDPTNVAEISQAIERLRTNKDLRLNLGNCARHKAKNMTIKSRVDDLLRFILEVIDA